MGESSVHFILVKSIVDWVAVTFPKDEAISIYVDSVESAHIPPRIESYVPDVYVEWTSLDRKIIGEAKTAEDLEREHSRQQIAAFLRYLGRCDEPKLVIATPWHAVNNAKGLLDYIKRRESVVRVPTVVIEKLPG